MESIRIERLRCLSDTGEIAIKPVTVLLGQNSSGKSTFLRVFPLLKQSIEAKTTGPILWNGRLVDFGSYNDAHQSHSDNSISFNFKLQIPQKNKYIIRPIIYDRVNLQKNTELELIDLTIQITQCDQIKFTRVRVSQIALGFAESKVVIGFDEEENISDFHVNFLNILELGCKYKSEQAFNNYLLPKIYEFSESKRDENLGTFPSEYRTFSHSKLTEILFKKIKNLAHHATSQENIYNVLNYLSFISISNSESILNYIKTNQFTGKQEKWKNNTQAWTIETKEFQELRDIIIAITIPFIIEQCDRIIASISKKVSYMGPVRATAQRYYRIQDLAVDEVDYQGQNLAMFFGNLTDFEKEHFAKWTRQYFGFELYTNSSFGHISLEIKSEHSSDEKINIADTGFGFSQILPVITQLWLISSALPQRRQMQEAVDSSPVIFAVEQPELHLHPRLQGVLTDAFVKSIKAAKDNRVDLRLVIETHSEVLVNRLGDLVAENLISSDDINIVLFEPSDEPNKVNVKISEFNSEGYLLNWPLGFFNR